MCQGAERDKYAEKAQESHEKRERKVEYLIWTETHENGATS